VCGASSLVLLLLPVVVGRGCGVSSLLAVGRGCGVVGRHGVAHEEAFGGVAVTMAMEYAARGC
jgi:hypothetical protein